ncbi:MAG TPA: hypothetical protein VMU57_12565 [Edaphobacter sp.]|uniref:hypothetical protein n=1 Tax=Edaphobacter sp. TaxID=1934404 RepID=UPI002B582F1A|nr:hypothetical protein [Edaphobacter sp.]HUZ95734.1 hypothetical protein [Edaphobacter sp.]
MRVDEYNSFANQLQRYASALSRLESLHIRLADGCRLRAYQKRLAQVTVDPRSAIDSQLVIAVTYDLREIDEVNEIVENLPATLDSETLTLLQKVASGSEHPDDELDAPGREAQYELYLGTMLRRGGIPARHGKPDLVATWHNKEFFIEAKRPASAKGFDNRLRSAVHQARALVRPGIIAVCVDQLVRPADGLMVVKDFNALAPSVDNLVRKFVVEQAHTLRKRLSTNEPVAALLLTARVPARIAATGHSSLGTSIQLHPLLAGSIEAKFASSIIPLFAGSPS